MTYPVDTSGWHEYRAWGRNDHHRFFTHIIEHRSWIILSDSSCAVPSMTKGATIASVGVVAKAP